MAIPSELKGLPASGGMWGGEHWALTADTRTILGQREERGVNTDADNEVASLSDSHV